mgnify:CR=1 FL=1
MFRSTAEGETGHAHGHLEYLEETGDPATGLPIGSTSQNLAAAIAGETHEYTDMYPGMAKTARDEDFDENELMRRSMASQDSLMKMLSASATTSVKWQSVKNSWRLAQAAAPKATAPVGSKTTLGSSANMLREDGDDATPKDLERPFWTLMVSKKRFISSGA